MTIVFKTLILYLYWVHGIEFPGKCPTVPLTHFKNNENIELMIKPIVGIPFSIGHQSHFFKSFKIMNPPFYEGNVVLRKAINQEWFEYMFADAKTVSKTGNFNLYNLRGKISKYGHTNKSLKMTSVFYLQVFESNKKIQPEKQCHETITEDVRLWEDTDFIIIWSCVEREDLTTHDEAVSMFSNLYGRDGPDIDITLRQLNETARKYLSGLILEEIDWSPYTGFTNLTVPSPVDCLKV